MFLSTKSLPFFLFFVIYCHGQGSPERNKTSLQLFLDAFAKGEYKFEIGQSLAVYDSEESKEKSYKVHTIDGYDNCLGLTTDAFETIVLECPGKKLEKPECFSIFTPKTKPQNKTIIPAREIVKVCIRTIGAHCVGVATPLKCMILLKCLPSSTIVPQFGIRVPSNGPPPRM
ncbi:uncharacterized protein LOC108905683 isoform X3 [Anoplophora glabripennis]|uniref:uncharacterized protein LOC108905683 isoform X3 n=1 Tax=Anoplophora glabripennis TaxID=217634 RepID=UPI000874E1C6|nr:uncharacterized protein LOC108905683 isoform X3 [Anoplophora glabripennis]